MDPPYESQIKDYRILLVQCAVEDGYKPFFLKVSFAYLGNPVLKSPGLKQDRLCLSSIKTTKLFVMSFHLELALETQNEERGMAEAGSDHWLIHLDSAINRSQSNFYQLQSTISKAARAT